MRWCRIRFVLLGLLLCVVQVVSGSCGQRFTDPASSAVVSSIVLEGKLQSASAPNSKGIFNIVVKFKNVLKGKEKLKKGGKLVQKVSIGNFSNGTETNEQCVVKKVPSNTNHYFFLKEAKSPKAKGLLRFEMVALPVKKTKKLNVELKKVVCDNCAKTANVHNVSGPAQVHRGDRLVLVCSFEGNPAPNISWERENETLQTGDGVSISTSKLMSKLVVKSVTDDDLGRYDCVAANVLGESRKYFGIKAKKAKVTSLSGPDLVNRGDTLVITCVTQGFPTPSVTWKMGNRILQQGYRHDITTTELNSTLVVTAVSDEDIGRYECVAANSWGESRQHYDMKAKKASVTVSGPAQVNRSDMLVVNCSVEGIPAPQITWRRGNETLQTGDRFTITTTKLNSSLVVYPVSDNDTGFECVAANSWGESRKHHWLRDTGVLCVVQTFCLNGGTCYYLESLGLTYCKCARLYDGRRCEKREPGRIFPDKEDTGQASTFFEKPPVLVAILVGLLLFIMVCLASFYLVKRCQKRQQQQRQRKNQEGSETSQAGIEERNTRGRPAVVSKWESNLKHPHEPASQALIQPSDIQLQDYSPPPAHQSQPTSGSGISQQALRLKTSTNDSSRKPETRNRLAASSSVYDNFGNSDISDSSAGADTPTTRNKTAGRADTKVMFDINTGNIATDHVDKNHAYKNLNSFMRPTYPVDRPLALPPPSLPKLSSASSSSSAQLPSTLSNIVSSQSGILSSSLPQPSELFETAHKPAAPSSSPSSQNSSSEQSPFSTGKLITADHPVPPNHANASYQSVHPAESHYDNKQITQQQNQPPEQGPTILTPALPNEKQLEQDKLLSGRSASRDDLRPDVDQQLDLFICEDDIDLSKENLKNHYFSSDHEVSKPGNNNKEDRPENLTRSLKPRFSPTAGERNSRKSPATNRNLPLKHESTPSPPTWSQPSSGQASVSSEKKHLNSIDADSPDLNAYSNVFPQSSPPSAARVYLYDPNEDTTPWDRDISHGDNPHYLITAEASSDHRHRLKDVLPDQRAIPI